MILRPGSGGERQEREANHRAVFGSWASLPTRMSGPVGSSRSMFGCRSPSARRHARQSPHPPSGHSSAAVKARMARRFPDPSGPENR